MHAALDADDSCAADFRKRILEGIIAKTVWMPRSKELSAADTHGALQKDGLRDGVGGFCLARVEEAIDGARKHFATIVRTCRTEMLDVYLEHLAQRRPNLRRTHSTDGDILNELTAADVRGALTSRGFAFPYAMVRGEMASVKAECLTEPSTEEMKRAYLAGPPPPVPPPLPRDAGTDAGGLGLGAGDPADAMIDKMLSCRVTPSVDDSLELSIDQLEENMGKFARVIIEESQAWLAQHPFAFHVEGTGADGSVPPLRPGGSVCIHGLIGRPELNGQKALLVKWHEDAGRWWVYVEIVGRCTEEHVRVRPSNLEALDSETWFEETDPHHEWGSISERFLFAQLHPLQARSVGVRFDEAGKPIWFPPPPAALHLRPSHLRKIFSGPINDSAIKAWREELRIGREEAARRMAKSRAASRRQPPVVPACSSAQIVRQGAGSGEDSAEDQGDDAYEDDDTPETHDAGVYPF